MKYYTYNIIDNDKEKQYLATTSVAAELLSALICVPAIVVLCSVLIIIFTWWIKELEC